MVEARGSLPLEALSLKIRSSHTRQRHPAASYESGCFQDFLPDPD